MAKILPIKKAENPVIRLFRDEFSESAWAAYCEILGIDKSVSEEIVSVELTVSRVLPQIN